ncbi:GGDEF domain-containing protein [Mycolicibacterium helvum]|uniref:GGDEF domain-containing protein n=1 Tax=Mycolicibacterium helvum TaxID=1534349 RepID=A0A7I7T4Q6_9MYCO|nr:GGDEF domain-containing protein [Mycolicibacterium helvum]BBY63491.1 hypothetical protein MHEL_17340 [Mycolicibacterium helvum]
MSELMSWWRRPDQYDQLSSYLQARGMATAMRLRVAGIAASLSVVVASSIWSPLGPHGTAATVLALVASAVGAGGAALWLSRWPSRTQAIAFALASTTAVTIAALVQSNPVACLLGCTALAALAVHVAFFYAAPVVAYNIVCATAVACIAAVRLTPTIGFGSALAAWWLMVSVNLAAPIGLHMTSRVIGPDVFLADRDPLTGLWNRRAFLLRAEQLLLDSRGGNPPFVLAIIDLDRFKQINDRHGHLIGDQALASVARALLECCDSQAIVGRLGGEEFAVAASLRNLSPETLALTMCKAVAALPHHVTASVGITKLDAAPDLAVADAPLLLARLISDADTAMYAAKTEGGNQVRYSEQAGADDNNPR